MTAHGSTRARFKTDSFTIDVLPETPKPAVAAKVAIFDPNGETEKLLSELGVQYTAVGAERGHLAGYDIFVIGKHALTLANPKLNLARVREGLKVIVFEQTGDVLEKAAWIPHAGVRPAGGVSANADNHPALAGLDHGEPPRLARRGHHRAAAARPVDNDELRGSTPKSNGAALPPPGRWRCGCQGTVATVLIEKPAAGDFLPLVDGGFGLEYSPLLEYREGTGMVLFCQLDVTGRTESDPAATRLSATCWATFRRGNRRPHRKLLYRGRGRRQVAFGDRPASRPPIIKAARWRLTRCWSSVPAAGQNWPPMRKTSSPGSRRAAGCWPSGLDKTKPTGSCHSKSAMKKAEYVCGSRYTPAATTARLPASPRPTCTIRSPRELPLISGGATTLGDGVLAKADSANVVFCQLVPWQFEYQKSYNWKPTFRRSSFALSRLLANMGVVGGHAALARLSQEPLPVPGGARNDQASGKTGRQPNAIWHKLPRGLGLAGGRRADAHSSRSLEGPVGRQG